MVMIPGILLAIRLGWNPTSLNHTPFFPNVGIVQTIEDGDTFTVQSGETIRLLGVNAPDRGTEGFASSRAFLSTIVSKKTLYFEYDRYQDDKYGRVLAWVWVDCEDTPTFLPSDYMHLSNNQSPRDLPRIQKDAKKGNS